MLVHRRVTRMAAALSSPYPVIQLGGERHCESKVSCPKTQHNVPGQVTFLLKFNLLVSFFPFFSYGTIRDRAREVIPYSCGASFIRELLVYGVRCMGIFLTTLEKFENKGFTLKTLL